ncbi:3-keto-steroid reductase [Arthroderma uncinatum]|uniref:3-keto-steroid reductase n=1 Tax=Arthroderma uncinatum TaxID=74035 RepID=UPI00144AB8D6|nr:3-keto-steroid reductase [Arthroderma uncinatum]KAF3481413.1 3-keto-steroid reductase [Arthroderma uncinatum]
MAEQETYILITGTNSGLGFSTCCRLIDEFLASRPDSQSLTLIFTTRSEKKSNETLVQLKGHLEATTAKLHSPEVVARARSRIRFTPEHVDLCDLLSVRAMARRIATSIPKLDVLILNAGVAGFTGLNWPMAVWTILTDTVHGLTWPAAYTYSDTGVMNRKQTTQPDEPPMGKIFCANVFGHYMLAHYLVSVLEKSTPYPGRVIWTSSLEAAKDVFSVNDMQGLKVAQSYQSGKYLTDILALTYPLSSSAPWVDNYLAPSSCDGMGASTKPSTSTSRPNIYLAHPGICSTSIVPLALPLVWSMMLVCWAARLIGSPWHVITSYRGANTAVWLSLSPQSTLDNAEAEYKRLGGGKAKWGSSCDRLGKESVASTEVEGWGYGGVAGPAVLEADKSRRRKRGAVDTTVEAKEEFIGLGRECWRHMEELREKWEVILSREEAKSGGS